MISPESKIFKENLAEIIDDLERRSIDYRVIGSLALDAHGIVAVDFSKREGSIREIDQRPDVDILVPRSELKGAREVRKRFDEPSSYPIKVGLAIPSMLIDFRRETSSYLTYGKKSLEIDTKVFDAERGNFQGLPINVVSAETLRHMYGHMSTPSHKKRAEYLYKYGKFDEVIGKDSLHTEGDPYMVFHEYEKLLTGPRSLSQLSMDVYDRLTSSLSSEAQDRLRKAAFGAASLFGWR